MDWQQIFPYVVGTVGTLLSGLCFLLWFLISRLVGKVDTLSETIVKAAETQAERFNTVDSFIRTELRALDVRLSVVETLVKK